MRVAFVLVTLLLAGCAGAPVEEPDALPEVTQRPISAVDVQWRANLEGATDCSTGICFIGAEVEDFAMPRDKEILSLNLTLELDDVTAPVLWQMGCNGCSGMEMEGTPPLHMEWDEAFPMAAMFSIYVERTDQTSLDDFTDFLVNGARPYVTVSGTALVAAENRSLERVETPIAFSGTAGCVVIVESGCSGSFTGGTPWYTLQPMGIFDGLDLNVTWDTEPTGSDTMQVTARCYGSPFYCDNEWGGPYEVTGSSPLRLEFKDPHLPHDAEILIQVEMPDLPLFGPQPGRQSFSVEGAAWSLVDESDQRRPT